MGQVCHSQGGCRDRYRPGGCGEWHPVHGYSMSKKVGFDSIGPDVVDVMMPPPSDEVALERFEYCEDSQAGNQESWPVISMDFLFREHLHLLRDAGLKLSSWFTNGGWVTEEDTLLVVGMQNDYLPGKFAPHGGRAGVPEGEAVVGPIVRLIEAFAKQNALIVATRDFHAADHACFYEQGGSQPSHCIQSTPGANFYRSIAEALERAYCEPLKYPQSNGLPGQPGRVEIAFKGVLEAVASPSAFRYGTEQFEQRCRTSRLCSKSSAASVTKWTGGMALKCSNLAYDINANPDLSALLQPDLRPLDEVVPRSGRLLIVGLSLDIGVLDTAVAASRLGYEKVFIAVDACRPTYFGPTGEYGSGFLTDPAHIMSQMHDHNIRTICHGEVIESPSTGRLSIKSDIEMSQRTDCQNNQWPVAVERGSQKVSSSGRSPGRGGG